MRKSEKASVLSDLIIIIYYSHASKICMFKSFLCLILYWNLNVSKTATLKLYPNGRNNLTMVRPTMLGVVVAKRFTGFKLFAATPNNTQQHTTSNRMCKWTQHVKSNNVESCCMALGQLIRSRVAWPDNFNLHCVILWNVRVFHFPCRYRNELRVSFSGNSTKFANKKQNSATSAVRRGDTAWRISPALFTFLTVTILII